MKSPCLVASAACLSLALAASAVAQSPPLGHAVPRDWHVYIHGVTSASPDPAWVAFERAVGSLVASRVHEDIIELATMELPEDERREARATAAHVIDLLGHVDWAALMAHEIVFAEKIATPIPEYMFVFRAPADVDPMVGMRGLLEGLAEMIGAPVAQAREVERRSGAVTELAIERSPVQLAAGIVGDALVFSTSTRQTAAAMRRLQGGGSGSLVETELYQTAFAQLPASTEGEVFVNVEGLLGFVSQALGLASAAVGRDEHAAGAVAFGRALLEELDVVDHVAVSTVSDGTTVTMTSLTVLDEDFEDSRFAALFAGQRPWADWHSMVPADATGFVFDTGCDVGGLVELVIELAADNLAATEWIQSPTCTKVREIAGHVSGEVAFVSFPQAGDSGCSAGESVCMIRLEQTEGVADWLRAHLDAAVRYVHDRGQHMAVETHGELHEVRLSALPWIRPTVGVHDGMLVIATSRAAVEHLDRVRRGELPDIRSSQRFAALDVGNGLGGVYLDYGQLDTGMAALADVMGSVGFCMALLPRDRDTKAVIRAGMLMTKLAAAFRELDLRYDTAGEMLPSETPNMVLGRRIYRYR